MLTVIVSGLAIGMLFAAVALVYNVMYSTSKVLSVTTGHISMLGGVFGAYIIASLQMHWLLGLLGFGFASGVVMFIAAAGVVGFFAVPYTIVLYPIIFVFMGRMWSVSHRHGYVTSHEGSFRAGRDGARPGPTESASGP